MKLNKIKFKSKLIIKYFLEKIGFILKPINTFNDEATQLANYFLINKIKTILDIGANKGQFAKSILNKKNNYKVLSVEPILKCHEDLLKESKRYKNWKIYKEPVAISDIDGLSKFKITRSDHSSSLLEPIYWENIDERISRAHEVIDKKDVKTITIKQLLKNTGINPEKTCLKLDIQGMEFFVIRSILSEKILFKNILIETSLEPLYFGEKNFEEIKTILFQYGYKIDIVRHSLVSEKTFKTLQLNVCFSLI